MRVIAGEARGGRLKSIKGSLTRPTSDRIKEALFNILAPYLPVEKGLDLFAGFGGLGIEALSRGVREMTFVEKDLKTCRVLEENLNITGFAKRGRIIKGDVLSFLRKEKSTYDLILMDPPYQEGYVNEVLKLLIKGDLIREAGIIVVEHERDLKLEEIGDLSLINYKRYDDTALSLFRKGGQ